MQRRKHALSPFVPFGVSVDSVQDCAGELFAGGFSLWKKCIILARKMGANQAERICHSSS